MATLVIKDRVYEAASEGLHNATVTKVEDLGLQETTYGTKDRARIVFTMDDQKDKEGQPVEVWMPVTKSLHSKSSLGKFLAAVKISTKGEFDLNEIVGLKLQVVITQKDVEGKIYANIATVIPLKGKTVTTEV
jgi:hypothetical protein